MKINHDMSFPCRLDLIDTIKSADKMSDIKFNSHNLRASLLYQLKLTGLFPAICLTGPNVFPLESVCVVGGIEVCLFYLFDSGTFATE